MLVANNKLSLSIWGESHAKAIGMKLSGIEKGITIDLDLLQSFVDRRKSIKSVYSTSRGEEDKVIITSGIENGITSGECIEAMILNKTYQSSDYDYLKYTPRPSHADYPAYVKYQGKCDMRGGGKFSGRMTAPLCIAGGIAEQILEKKGITLGSYISEIANVKGVSYKDREIALEEVKMAKTLSFPIIDTKYEQSMLAEVEKAKKDGDSVGGVVEVIAFNVPAGLGDAMFDSLESNLAKLLFGVPAVKGVEFGIGFDIAHLKGSQANDCYYYDDDKVKTYTNNNGGILGGISTGMPITCRVAFKPTPSISKLQNTINLQTGENTQISVIGRHDACIVPRAAVCVEACMALAILESII
jgi:chorismate synthase